MGTTGTLQPLAADYRQPSLPTPMSLNLPSPEDLSMLSWQQQEIVKSLAQHIASTAVENKQAIPDVILAAYHDALKLHISLKAMHKDSQDEAMNALHSY